AQQVAQHAALGTLAEVEYRRLLIRRLGRCRAGRADDEPERKEKAGCCSSHTAVRSCAERSSKCCSRSNKTSGTILAPPASRQLRNLSKSSASLSGRSAWPFARATFALSTTPPPASSTRTWSKSEAPETSGS